MGLVVNILAIETATPSCAIGLVTSSGDEFAFVAEDERHHTEALTPGIRELLARASLSAKAVDRVVVDRGPGLFTGLRVGIATAIGFALGASADLVGVTSLELLARGAHASGVRGTLVSCVDGRRGELFVQTFALGDAVEEVDGPVVAVANDVVATWMERGDAVTLTGDGVVRYRDEFERASRFTLFDQLVPPTSEALRLGRERSPVEAIVPLYLRESDAVANFSTRQRS